MNMRDPGVVGMGAVGVGALFVPGPGLMTPILWFGRPHFSWVLPMAAVIFCVVYFGTLQFWKMLTGDALRKPIPGILALFLAIRLSVDCARLLMWQ